MDILAKLKELRDEIDGLYEATLASSQEYHRNRAIVMVEEIENAIDCQDGE